MKKSSRWIAILSAAVMAAGVIAAVPTTSMEVQAAGAKVKSTAAYDTKWTTQYPTTTLLKQALSNPKTNADGIYQQLMMAFKYSTINETQLVQLIQEGTNIPASVLQRLGNEGWISQTLVNTLTGVQTTTATPTYTSAAFADVFDAAYYVSANPAIAAAVQNGTLAGDTETLFQNWLLCGLPAGLSGNATFNIATYEAQHPDIVTALGGDRLQEVLYYIQTK